MKFSNYFSPTLSENPAEAEIISHKLMIRAGLIKQASAGIYSWLPLGLKVLKKIEQIVREEQNNAGAIEVLMPTIQSADLWIKSGRYEDYGKEMLRIKDRSGREMLYGPTNEELITDVFQSYINSYKDLPLNLYHIQWKFRDELRPRFGVMRGREFLMKDNYSFDLNEEAAKISYNKMFKAYIKTFLRMGLTPISLRAETGPIGGNLSHEFQILAKTGESTLYYDKKLETIAGLTKEEAYARLLEKVEDENAEDLRARYEKLARAGEEAYEAQANNILLAAIHRIGNNLPSNIMTSHVEIESDDLKGKVIGKEGRNVRAFERATGVDVLIDESPGYIVLSSFDPVRREIARVALEALLKDGRIQPAKIEECVEKARMEVAKTIKAMGEKAVYEAKVPNLHLYLL